jgi:hypothetical protein
MAASCLLVDISGKRVSAFDQALASADTLKRICCPRLSSDATPFFQASNMVPFMTSSLRHRRAPPSARSTNSPPVVQQRGSISQAGGTQAAAARTWLRGCTRPPPLHRAPTCVWQTAPWGSRPAAPSTTALGLSRSGTRDRGSCSVPGETDGAGVEAPSVVCCQRVAAASAAASGPPRLRLL